MKVFLSLKHDFWLANSLLFEWNITIHKLKQFAFEAANLGKSPWLLCLTAVTMPSGVWVQHSTEFQAHNLHKPNLQGLCKIAH